MSRQRAIRRPVLARHARYRWDELRGQHQIVFPEGVLVLNDTGAAIVRHCDGRTTEALIAELESQFENGDPAADVSVVLLANQALLAGWTTERPRQAMFSNAVCASLL